MHNEDEILMMKLDYLCKEVREKKNIGINLIEILDNENAIKIIHSQAEIELKKALNSYIGNVSNQEIIFISLVLIAMLHYCNGNYYEYVKATYNRLYRQYSEQKIEGLIRTILSRYCVQNREELGRTRIINIVLENTIVPSYYLKSFFEFIYDIYKLNFEYELTDNLNDDFKFVYDGLRDMMNSKGDNVQVSVTKKSYKLIKSTKQLILDEKGIDSVIILSIIVIKLIDKKVWGQDIHIVNPYLKKGFDEWSSTYQNDITSIRRRENTSEFRSRWEPKYFLSGNEICIDPPVHKIKTQYDYRKLSVIVENGEKILYRNVLPDVREIIGGYQINIERFAINKPLGQVTYRLLYGEEELYSTKEKMYRSYIVFDGNGKEISNNTDYSGTAIFCTNNLNEEMKVYYRDNNYMLSSKNIKLGETCIIDNSVFNFSSLIEPGVLGDEWENYAMRCAGETERIKIYKKVRFLIFECSNEISKLEILVDRIRKKLNDYHFSLKERTGINRYVIEIDGLQNGIHTIEVNTALEGKKNRILLSKFAVDSKLSVDCEKMRDDAYLVTVDSSLLNASIVQKVYADTFCDEWLSCSVDGITYILDIPFDFGFYQIGNSKWNPFSNELWIDEISQDTVLSIYGDVDTLQVISNKGNVLEQDIKLSDNGSIHQVRVGFLVSYRSSYEYSIVLLLKDGKIKNGIFCYNRCVLDQDRTERIYDPVMKCLKIVPQYWGKGKVFFRILCNDSEIYKSGFLQSGIPVLVSGLNSFTNYKITFYEKEKGLSLKKERCIGEYEDIFYAYEDFVGRSFRIKKVVYDQFVNGELIRNECDFNNTYVFFKEMQSEGHFLGEIYAKTYNGIYKLNKINPVDIEICSDIIDESLELAITTKDGDGLLLDIKHHGIKNTLYDNSAVDIFSYTIDMKGEKRFE